MSAERCPKAFVENGDHVWVSIPASNALSSRPLLVCCHCREMRDGFDHRVIKPGEQPAAAPEMPRPPAEEARERPETPGTGSGRGTGVAEAEVSVRQSEWPDVDGWSVRLVGGEVVVRRDSDERQLSGWDIPLGAVLAFIADQQPEEDDEETDLSPIPADLIKSDPGIRGGEPCIVGTRVPAHEVAGYLADGATWDEVREMLPSLPSLPVPSTEKGPADDA